MADELFPISDSNDGFAPSGIDEGLPTRAEFDLAIDFWFEVDPTFSDVYWPIALAVAWIAWRDADLATLHFDRFRTSGRRYWLSAEAAGRVAEPREAERLLLNALRAGDLTAFGVRNTAMPGGALTMVGDREPIGKHRWIDLRLFGPKAGDLLEDAVIGGDGRKMFTDLRLHSREVQAVWPIVEAPYAIARKPPGPEPKEWRRVETAMRAVNSFELEKMNFEEMAARFGASTTYCGKVRRQVLEDKTDRNK